MDRSVEAHRISKDANITDYGDGSFMINIPHCLMCNPIHNVMGTDVKGICPMAFIVGAASSFGEQAKSVELDYSKLTPTGTSRESSSRTANQRNSLLRVEAIDDKILPHYEQRGYSLVY